MRVGLARACRIIASRCLDAECYPIAFVLAQRRVWEHDQGFFSLGADHRAPGRFPRFDEDLCFDRSDDAARAAGAVLGRAGDVARDEIQCDVGHEIGGRWRAAVLNELANLAEQIRARVSRRRHSSPVEFPRAASAILTKSGR